MGFHPEELTNRNLQCDSLSHLSQWMVLHTSHTAMSAETEEGDDGFGIERLGFSTQRRPAEYRRTTLTEEPPHMDDWFRKYPSLMGEHVAEQQPELVMELSKSALSQRH